jgi:hypothetical protein
MSGIKRETGDKGGRGKGRGVEREAVLFDVRDIKELNAAIS